MLQEYVTTVLTVNWLSAGPEKSPFVMVGGASHIIAVKRLCCRHEWTDAVNKPSVAGMKETDFTQLHSST